MKTLQVAAFASLLLGSLAAHAGDPVIHVTVGGEISPGVYGRVEVGNAPPPPVVYAQPIVVTQQPDEGRPIYLHVPPGHAKHWARHCREYNACNRPVYFVKSAEYEPGYHDRRDGGRRDEGRGDEERREEGRGDEGRGHGHGHRDDDREDGDRRGNGRGRD